jgi:hypothetical protein
VACIIKETVMKKASVRWLKETEGGRAIPPPRPKYSTVARFPEEGAELPDIAWSLVLEWSTSPDINGTMIVDVRFLSPDAPAALLHAGAVFELYEGRRCVARGEILAE